MKILNLSETTLSGAPIRLNNLINKYTPHESRHIVWKRQIFNRVFPVDLVGEEMSDIDLEYWLHWADLIHYHNIYEKQSIFKKHLIPNKPSLIQVHSPKSWFDHDAVTASGLPIAVIAQFHVREWPNLSYIVPNVVDINEYSPAERNNPRPIISFAPSSGNGKGPNDKGYGIVVPYLRRLEGIQFQKIFSKPYLECMQMKRHADIGVDDINTGSYHMSTLEYLQLGVATICYTDELTEKVVKDLTGCTELPWIHAGHRNIGTPVRKALNNYKELGNKARLWVEQNWNPTILCNHYITMYSKLV
jgi:hypothetical protein